MTLSRAIASVLPSTTAKAKWSVITMAATVVVAMVISAHVVALRVSERRAMESIKPAFHF